MANYSTTCRAILIPHSRYIGRWMRLWVVLIPLFPLLLIALVFFPRSWRQCWVKKSARGLLFALGIRWQCCGDQPRQVIQGRFIVANHISWVDILAILATHPVCFVAKAEIRHWPVIGYFAARAGTLFLERQRRQDVARVNQLLQEVLARGDCPALFPEGKIGDGQCLLPFNPALLQPAINHAAHVLPLGLRYHTSCGMPSSAPSYAGEISLWQSLRAILATPQLCVSVYYCDPVLSQGYHRRELAQVIANTLATRLNLPHFSTNL